MLLYPRATPHAESGIANSFSRPRDAAKVEKGMDKKTVTRRWAHSIEKLPCKAY